MKILRIAGLGLLLMGMAALIATAFRPTSEDATGASQPMTEAEALPTMAETALTPRSDTPPRSDPLAGELLLESFACRYETCTGTERALSASSVEEAMWMKANGFPTREERDWAANRSAAEILRRAQSEGSAALKALALEARLRERTQRMEALEIYDEQLTEGLSGGKRYFFYGAFQSALVQSQEAAARSNERQLLAMQPGSGNPMLMQPYPFRAAEALAIAVALGDYRALELARSAGAETTGVRDLYAQPQTSRNAWRTIQDAAQMPGAPISIRTPQPRPLPPPGSD